jgi:hypothetical protein
VLNSTSTLPRVGCGNNVTLNIITVCQKLGNVNEIYVLDAVADNERN